MGQNDFDFVVAQLGNNPQYANACVAKLKELCERSEEGLVRMDLFSVPNADVGNEPGTARLLVNWAGGATNRAAAVATAIRAIMRPVQMGALGRLKPWPDVQRALASSDTAEQLRLLEEKLGDPLVSAWRRADVCDKLWHLMRDLIELRTLVHVFFSFDHLSTEGTRLDE